MGRVGWIGVALLAFGVASVVAWGMNSPPMPSPGLVVLTASEVARAALLALGMAASAFGLVLIVAREAETIRWGRGTALFCLMASLIGLALQGPEIVASLMGQDRRRVSAIHDGINGAMLLILLWWQVHDALARRARTLGSPS